MIRFDILKDSAKRSTIVSCAMSLENKKKPSGKSLLLLSLTSLGIVYGDIGTSPLYAINEIFFGHGTQKVFPHSFTLGAISLVLWSLTIIVSFKYIIFVLRADNDGEGGVFALYGLLNKISTRTKIIIMALLGVTQLGK